MASVDFSGAGEWGRRFPLRQMLRSGRVSQRTVVAAVCYRIQTDGEMEFLLVRTRAGRWTFPKGGVDDDRSAAEAAAREAYEEAGVLGRVEQQAFAGYLHCKGDDIVHRVFAYLCQVEEVETPAESYRTPTWFPAEKAKRRLRQNRSDHYGLELERVVDGAVRRVWGRRG